jgi:O-antigen ligase
VVSALWAGVTIGAVLAGGVAVIQVVVLGHSRAEGPGGNAIVFGNLALLMGALSAVLLGHPEPGASDLVWSRVPAAASAAAVVAGVSARVLSGSRGGWLAIPMIAALLVLRHCCLSAAEFPRRWLALAVLAAVGAVGVAGGMPVDRLGDAVGDVTQYLRAEPLGPAAGTTIGARVEAWRSITGAFHRAADPCLTVLRFSPSHPSMQRLVR